jgi:hypothetical protein
MTFAFNFNHTQGYNNQGEKGMEGYIKLVNKFANAG